jgi:hypothetical protein
VVVAAPSQQNATFCAANPSQCIVLLGTTTTQAERGLIVYNESLSLRARAVPGAYAVAFTATLPSTGRVLAPVQIALRLRQCVVGEVAPSEDRCVECGRFSFSWEPHNPACQSCPDGAQCQVWGWMWCYAFCPRACFAA